MYHIEMTFTIFQLKALGFSDHLVAQVKLTIMKVKICMKDKIDQLESTKL